jgi:hypothetical protein
VSEYKTVALRVAEFHKSRTDTQRITTDLVYHDEGRVVMKATVWDGDVAIGTGYGEEWRDSSNINKTSAMENAETSSIGRSLACIGLGGSEYASADEVLRAIAQQEELQEDAPTPTQSSDTATNPPQPEPTTEDSEQVEWTSDIPDDILALVKENISIMRTHVGDDESKKWHSRALPNFLATDREDVKEMTATIKLKGVMQTIEGLSREQLADLAVLQNDKIKMSKED